MSMYNKLLSKLNELGQGINIGYIVKRLKDKDWPASQAEFSHEINLLWVPRAALFL